MSQTDHKFFENGFNSNKFTRRVNNLEWKTKDDMKVFGFNTSAVSRTQIEEEINNEKGAKQNTQVMAKLLNIDWVFNDSSTLGEVGGFGDLIEVLSKSPNESIFSTEFVIIMCDYFWDIYYHSIVVRVLLPYLVYWVATVYYFSEEIVEEFSTDKMFDVFSLESASRNLVCIFICYFFALETAQMFRDGWDYFFDFYNMFDLFSLLFNLFQMIIHIFRLEFMPLW